MSFAWLQDYCNAGLAEDSRCYNVCRMIAMAYKDDEKRYTGSRRGIETQANSHKAEAEWETASKDSISIGKIAAPVNPQSSIVTARRNSTKHKTIGINLIRRLNTYTSRVEKLESSEGLSSTLSTINKDTMIEGIQSHKQLELSVSNRFIEPRETVKTPLTITTQNFKIKRHDRFFQHPLIATDNHMSSIKSFAADKLDKSKANFVRQSSEVLKDRLPVSFSQINLKHSKVPEMSMPTEPEVPLFNSALGELLNRTRVTVVEYENQIEVSQLEITDLFETTASPGSSSKDQPKPKIVPIWPSGRQSLSRRLPLMPILETEEKNSMSSSTVVMNRSFIGQPDPMALVDSNTILMDASNIFLDVPYGNPMKPTHLKVDGLQLRPDIGLENNEEFQHRAGLYESFKEFLGQPATTHSRHRIAKEVEDSRKLEVVGSDTVKTVLLLDGVVIFGKQETNTAVKIGPYYLLLDGTILLSDCSLVKAPKSLYFGPPILSEVQEVADQEIDIYSEDCQTDLIKSKTRQARFSVLADAVLLHFTIEDFNKIKYLATRAGKKTDFTSFMGLFRHGMAADDWRQLEENVGA